MRNEDSKGRWDEPDTAGARTSSVGEGTLVTESAAVVDVRGVVDRRAGRRRAENAEEVVGRRHRVAARARREGASSGRAGSDTVRVGADLADSTAAGRKEEVETIQPNFSTNEGKSEKTHQFDGSV